MNKIIGIALLCIITGYFVFEYQYLQTQVDKDKTIITALNSTIETQNNAVEELKKESDIKLQNLAKALEVAHAQTIVRTSKAQIIYKTLPAVPGDDCKSALILGNQE